MSYKALPITWDKGIVMIRWAVPIAIFLIVFFFLWTGKHWSTKDTWIRIGLVIFASLVAMAITAGGLFGISIFFD
jgi:hypothetical protein